MVETANESIRNSTAILGTVSKHFFVIMHSLGYFHHVTTANICFESVAKFNFQFNSFHYFNVLTQQLREPITE
jgi:hypothetical protein